MLRGERERAGERLVSMLKGGAKARKQTDSDCVHISWRVLSPLHRTSLASSAIAASAIAAPAIAAPALLILI